MKSSKIFLILFLSLFFKFGFAKNFETKKLPKASTKIDYCAEIAVKQYEFIHSFYNKLKPQEKILVYYLLRASLPGNKILLDQKHRYALKVANIFETILLNEKKIKKLKNKLKEIKNLNLFIDQVKTYLVYLWSNHSPYFKREYIKEKRTPARLNLNLLTRKNLYSILILLDINLNKIDLEELFDFIFDDIFESTLVVANDIEKSAVNIYSNDFLNKDYENLDSKKTEGSNKYFYVKNKDGKRKLKTLLYRIGGKYSKELEISCFWLRKAFDYSKKYPEIFDKHFVKSFDFLIKFLKTGNESYFKKHSIEWLKSNSNIDYNFGFIEYYSDPKARRGLFQAEATIKSVNLNNLNKILPTLETKLPCPEKFKRSSLDSKKKSVPNASINVKIFAVGDLGPLDCVSAYCLPNYQDIRNDVGSKQIIYKPWKDLAQIINPNLYRKLFYSKKLGNWFLKNDLDWKFVRDLWELHVILHETIGHGSGKLAKHVFKPGEKLNICNVEYKVGDKIQVNPENYKEILAGYTNCLEELRAEIIALYTSVFHLDEMNKKGFLVEWIKKLGKRKVQEWLIWEMAYGGLKRLLTQNEEAQKVTGAHAIADTTILNYLVKSGGVQVIEEEKKINKKIYKVLDCQIKDFKKAKQAIKDLMIKVQTIKSTADIIDAKNLIDNYGKKIISKDYIKILQNNRKTIIGDVKATASIFPHFVPVINKKTKEIVDIQASWPKTIFEQQLAYSKLAYSKEINERILI